MRILCCGDSLTAGYYGNTDHYTPYGAQLSKRLGMPVDQIGRSGWRADEIVTNMGNQVCIDVFNRHGPGLAVQLAAKKYDICIVMAGTNDLAAGRSAESIVNDVKTLHNYCFARGVRTVALPIPESRFFTGDQCHAPQGAARTACNRLLRDWAATLKGRVLFVDMVQHVPYSDTDGNWAPDGLHMSQQGYATFGDKCASCNLPPLSLLAPPPPPRPSANPRPPRPSAYQPSTYFQTPYLPHGGGNGHEVTIPPMRGGRAPCNCSSKTAAAPM